MKRDEGDNVNAKKSSDRALSVVMLVTVVILALAVLLGAEYAVLLNSNRDQAYRTARVLEDQVRNILETNERKESALVESLKENYTTKAKAVSYIIDRIPGTETDIAELIRIAKLMAIDEIHIFDETGKIYAGTVPIYYGYSFESGEQMAYFKPMLEDKTLSMCQDVTPNTAEGKSMMYAICWNDSGERMVQIGIEPLRLLDELRTNEVSEVISNMPAYEGIEIIVADRLSGEIIGSTVVRQRGQLLKSLGIDADALEPESMTNFAATVEGYRYYCTLQDAGDYVIAILQRENSVNRSIPTIMLTLLLYLLLAVAAITYVARRMTLHILDEHNNANTDALTGLRNRRAYQEDMKALEQDPRRGDLIYMTLDLNGLKTANDALGHEAGDGMLIAAAHFMRESFGKYGELYRTGGDEFVALIFPDDEQLAQAEEAFARRTEAWSQRHDGNLTVSYGVARVKDEPGLSMMELAKLADERMYQAKAAYYRAEGRDRRR